MILPAQKTKIVCTIGPASRSEAVLERLMLQVSICSLMKV
jgi:pyruvate kinase